MGEEDMRRQRLNVFRMRLLGAKVVGVTTGSRTLKDAISEAMRDWVTNVGDTHYLLGSALGAHPYPLMVRDFHRVIGDRGARSQILEAEGRLPDTIIACVGGGSNAIGIFHPFLEDEGVKLIGVEAGGRGAAARASTLRDSPAVRRACCRAPTASCCRMRTARWRSRIRSRPGSIMRWWDPSTPGCTTAAAPNTPPPPTKKLWPRRGCWRTRKASSRRSNRHTPSLKLVRRAPSAKGQISIVNLSGRGDKDTDIYREHLRELDEPDAHQPTV